MSDLGKNNYFPPLPVFILYLGGSFIVGTIVYAQGDQAFNYTNWIAIFAFVLIAIPVWKVVSNLDQDGASSKYLSRSLWISAALSAVFAFIVWRSSSAPPEPITAAAWVSGLSALLGYIFSRKWSDPVTIMPC